MKTLSLVTSTRILLLGPCAARNLSALQQLLEICHTLWQDVFECDTDRFLADYPNYLQQLADLIPRYDKPMPGTGFNVGELSTDQVVRFFFIDSPDIPDTESIADLLKSDLPKDIRLVSPQIVELHQAKHESTEVEIKMPSWGDDISDWTPPVESCGDSRIDTIAALISAFKVHGGIKVWESFDRESISLLIQQYNEHQVLPEDRRNKYVAKMQEEYKRENADIYKKAMGLDAESMSKWFKKDVPTD